MKRISRRNFLKAAGVGAAALSLAACGGAASSTASSTASSAATSSAVAADVTIKVAAIETGYGAEMWKKVAEAFTAQTGIKVDLTTDKKLEDVIGPSMQGGDYPDVVHLATGREAALTEQFIKGNLIADITDVLSMTVPGESKKVSEKIAGGFTDTSLTNPYGDGKTYLAPMFYSPCGLFYNAGFLKEKGWDVPRPGTRCGHWATRLPLRAPTCSPTHHRLLRRLLLCADVRRRWPRLLQQGYPLRRRHLGHPRGKDLL